MSATMDNMLVDELPQDPFLPRTNEPPVGPAFLDTGACLCGLQEVSVGSKEKDRPAWNCVGNQTLGVYDMSHGKWFLAKDDKKKVRIELWDDSNPPNEEEAFFFDQSKEFLVPEKEYKGNVTQWDQACTGKNRTSFSTSYYRATDQVARNETPIDAAPCWRPNAVPILIQSVEDWVTNGCSPGFLCANNTVNSLPQYCPPLDLCQTARLGGVVCELNGTSVGMGPFEPIVCQAGHYCPGEGDEMLRCPSGHYCQPGAASPTPCAIGSRCPEGSTHQTLILPLVFLIIIDVFIVLGLLYLRFRHRFSSRAKLSTVLPRSRRGIVATATGYKSLEDTHENEADLEADREMLPMQPSYLPRHDTFNGFADAMAMQAVQQAASQVAQDDLPPQLRVFVESMRKATDATNFGLSFGYSGLRFQPKGVANPILQNVTGRIERGSLVAVMGGSGAGKSTFVNVLMGKISQTGGEVTVNNEAVKIKRFKKLIGYVPQDDIVSPELTVYENILHSAKIRLPRNWSKAEIKAHVEAVIDCLELSHRHDSLVGSVAKPVLSGGQRKRVSIGMELAAAPMAIFLDEPTSGLDSTAASSIMRTLQAIAKLGISVIVIIHQPRVEIFDMLDNLILLGNGQTIYEGSQVGVRPYFERIGFHFPEHSNHGDVITDIITGNGRPYKKAGDISKEALISQWAATQHDAAQTIRTESDRFSVRLSTFMPMTKPVAIKNRGASLAYQVWLSFKRAMLQQYRSKGTLAAEMGLSALAGILLGLAQQARKGVLFTGQFKPPYAMLSRALDFKSAPEVALLVAIAIGLTSGAPGVKVFSEEMLLHRREAEAGHSRIAYFIAKVFSVVPRMALACMHFTTPLFLLMSPVMGWGIAYLANLLYFYCIYGLASCVSMVVRREDAPLFSTMLALITGILSGSAPPLSSVREWKMEWLWRASPGTWLAELYFGQLVSPYEYLYDVQMASEKTGFKLGWLWQNILVLVGIGTIYRIIAFVAMVSLPRLRK